MRGARRCGCRAQASARKFWTVIGFFAGATPVGILLGVALSTVSNSDAAAAVSALASGARASGLACPALVPTKRCLILMSSQPLACP